MFENPILFYSSLCSHCKQLMLALEQYPELESIITKVNIDVNPHTKKRHELFYKIPKIINKPITEVPTLIVNNYFLVGTDVTSWFKTVISKQSSTAEQSAQSSPKQEDLQPFNPNEMLSFSDGYSTFGKDDDIKKQSYHFISDIQNNISTIPEDEFVDNREKDIRSREDFGNMTRKQSQQGFGGMPHERIGATNQQVKGVTRQQIESNKKASFDTLLEQKMLERQNF